jgi:hypothetical protein
MIMPKSMIWMVNNTMALIILLGMDTMLMNTMAVPLC